MGGGGTQEIPAFSFKSEGIRQANMGSWASAFFLVSEGRERGETSASCDVVALDAIGDEQMSSKSFPMKWEASSGAISLLPSAYCPTIQLGEDVW